MSKNLSELKDLAASRGLKVTSSGSRESKGDYEEAIRRSIWEEEFPGQPLPPHYSPMLAFDFKNLVPGKMNANDPDPADLMRGGSKWGAQEKMQGARCEIHIGQRSVEFGTRNYLHSRRVSDLTFRLNDNSGNFRHITDLEFPLEWHGAVFDGEGLSCRPDINTGDVVTRDLEKATIALVNCDPEKSQRIQQEQGFMNLHIFDCLFTKGGRDVRHLPYFARLEEVKMFFSELRNSLSSAGYTNLHTLPMVMTGKEEFYEQIVARGGEGVMLKDMRAPYEHKRTRAVYKRKKFVEVDGWVSGFIQSDPDAGWSDLIGALVFSAYTETGSIHEFAACANVTFEERRAMTVKGADGRPTLNPEYLGKIAAVRGMEWSSRNYRLTNARIQRWREGNDGKSKDECVIDLAAVKAQIAVASTCD